MYCNNSSRNCDEDDDEDIKSVCSDASRSYSDKFDSDEEEELYRKIYFSNHKEVEINVSNVSDSSGSVVVMEDNLQSSRNTMGGSDATPDPSKKKRSRKRKAKIESKQQKTNPELVVLSSSDSDDSVMLLDSWSSQDEDMLININDKMKTPKDDASSIEIDNMENSSYDPLVLDCTSTDNSNSSQSLQDTFSNKFKSHEDLWHIDPEDKTRVSRYSSRYFKKSVCRRCRETGHTMKNCSSPGFNKCFLCGGEHRAVYCRSKVCGVCYNNGHSRMNCPYKYDLFCSLCKMPGHSNTRCPDLWRRYHLTTTANTKLVKIKPNRKTEDDESKYCYNCGIRGHLGHRCKYRGYKSSFHPASPYVISYKKPMSSCETSTRECRTVNCSTPVDRTDWRSPNEEFANLGTSIRKTPKLRKKKKAKKLLKYQETNFVRTPTQESSSAKAEETSSSKKKKRWNGSSWWLKRKLKTKSKRDRKWRSVSLERGFE